MFNDKKITEAWLTDNSSLSKEEIKEVMENFDLCFLKISVIFRSFLGRSAHEKK